MELKKKFSKNRSLSTLVPKRYLLFMLFLSVACTGAKAATLNFGQDFCPHVEEACKNSSDSNCLKPWIDAPRLISNLKNKTLVFMTGLGGDLVDRSDYYDKTTLPILRDFGLNAIKLDVGSFSKSEAAAKRFCQWTSDYLNKLERQEQSSLIRNAQQMMFIGHSKAGRVLLRMAFEFCPSVLSSPRVHSILAIQASIGPSPLANWKMQFDSERWKRAQACLKTSNWDPQIWTKAGALMSPELGDHVESIMSKALSRSTCPECDRKFLFVTSTWSEECDPNRRFGNDTRCFVDPDGPNDIRLPLNSQFSQKVGRVVGEVSCAAHSDFFKTRFLPGHEICQEAMTLWLLQLAQNSIPTQRPMMALAKKSSRPH